MNEEMKVKMTKIRICEFANCKCSNPFLKSDDGCIGLDKKKGCQWIIEIKRKVKK